jgi:hypothetical protein
MPTLLRLSNIVMSWSFCVNGSDLGEVGQSKLMTVAIHAPRNSRFGGADADCELEFSVAAKKAKKRIQTEIRIFT